MSLLSLGLLFASLGLVVATPNKEAHSVSKEVDSNTLMPLKAVSDDSIPVDSEVTLNDWPFHSGKPSDLFDNDPETIYYLWAPNSNSYLNISFGSAKTIDDVQIIFNGDDYLSNFWLEYTNDDKDDDDKHWMFLGEFRDNTLNTINLKAFGVSATQLRIHSYDDNRHGGTSYWVQFAEIKINQGTFADDMIQRISFGGFGASYLPSDLGNKNTCLANMVDNNPVTFARFESATANSSYIQFDFNQEVNLSAIYYTNAPERETSSTDHILGAKVQYWNGSTYVEGDALYNFQNTYNRQQFYLGSVSTSSIKVVITNVYGWVIAGDFEFVTKNANEPAISVELPSENPAEKLNEGFVTDILDNSKDSYAWFAGRIESITLDFGKDIDVNDVSFMTGKSDGKDAFNACIKYKAAADEEFTDLVAEYRNPESDVIVLDTPVTARYVRLSKTYGAGWNAIRYFTVNNGNPLFSAHGDGLVLPRADHSSTGNPVDGDLNTVIWYDFHFSSGTYFEIDLREPKQINNIVFLQGGFINNSDAQKVDGCDDMLANGQLSYSVDHDSTWTDVGTYQYEPNVYKEFDSPVTARYIRMTYIGSEPAPKGVIIREFVVNFEKLDPEIEWGNYSEIQYDGNGQRGYYRYPYASGFTVSYRNVRSGGVSSNQPVNPGEYEVTITTEGNDIYNSCEETRSMHIMDTRPHFEADWNDMVKDYCNNTEALRNLIERYDNDLPGNVKYYIAGVKYTTSEGTFTIAQGVEYGRTRLGLANSGDSIRFNVEAKSYSNVIVMVTLVTVSSLFIVLFLSQKKKKATK